MNLRRAGPISARVGIAASRRYVAFVTTARLHVIYDGGCGFCEKLARRIRRWDRDGRIELVSLWDDDLETRFPAIRREEAVEQMMAVDAEGRVFRGADAFPPIFRLLRGGAFFRWPWLVPGGRALARLVYRWVAEHRHELPGGTAACDVQKAE